jgi:hypothetical protein
LDSQLRNLLSTDLIEIYFSPLPFITPTPTATMTPTPSITASQTVTPTPSITATRTQTPTPSITASQTVTPSVSPTKTPTPTVTNTPSRPSCQQYRVDVTGFTTISGTACDGSAFSFPNRQPGDVLFVCIKAGTTISGQGTKTLIGTC